ncbi:hypothetical protein IQ264_16455 [Phormidium sp. LEGE 05292]|uniref:hypothetical protein n=1 Tax=[Phormidium] sp. LEGE 05292 TaxID=767427 RepID=UPI0018812B28|nr:hypothetical protein [Phormidium sp. LEGE 05292]MBE9227021.1 hypothetical protein [Phormidium sp. LEGE 05292]
MQIENLHWHDYLLLASFIASIAGLWLINSNKPTQVNEREETERSLFLMIFTYWMVYCVADFAQKLQLPNWDILLMSLQITAAISYFLTVCCVIILPLHRFSLQQVAK